MPPLRHNILIYLCGMHKHGGPPRIVSLLSQEWAKTHQVTIVLDDAQPSVYPIGGEMYDLSAPASRHLVMKLVRRIQRTWRLARLIRQRRFTHLIGFEERINFQLIIASMLAGALGRTSVSVHLPLAKEAWHIRLMLMVLYHLPKRVVAVSAGIKQGLIRMGISARTIRLIHNPTFAPPSHPVPRPPVKGKYILAVGRLSTVKGFDLLLKAYAGLPQTAAKPAPSLVILGEGDERQALVAQAESLGIAGGGGTGKSVHFMGAVADPEAYYAHAECFVLSSRFEGWGLVLVEAMAYGCPVVSFDCPTGPREIIQHNKNGLLVEDGNVTALTKAIAKLLGDAKLRQQLIAGGRKRAGDFDIRRIAQEWLKP